MDVVEIEKYNVEEKFLDILDDCISKLETIREQVRQEIYYDELR